MRGATAGRVRQRGTDGAISIHAPHAGRDDHGLNLLKIILEFQSTRPMRGATTVNILFCAHCPFQSTRPMRGATYRKPLSVDGRNISIHAPHAGRDNDKVNASIIFLVFQSTRPMRGATSGLFVLFSRFLFQSTRPMRGATADPDLAIAGTSISIHAPHAGRDPPIQLRQAQTCYFNPRAPCGARQQKYTKLLYTLLRQKAILRQFHAKRRLLKRFSTYKYRNTFLICSANRMGKICTLPLRTTRSLDLPEGMSACSQSARFCFRTFFPSSKTAGYPAPDP